MDRPRTTRWIRRLIVIAAAIAAASPCWSSEEFPFEVSAPILSSGSVVSVRTVTVIDWGYPVNSPGWYVLLTTRPSYLESNNEPENRNAASLLGVRIRLHPQSTAIRPGDETWHHSSDDTLRIILDLTEIGEESSARVGGRPERTLERTVSCMILNAERDWYRPEYLHVGVEGDPRYAHFSGTYRLDSRDAVQDRDRLWISRRLPDK